MTGKARARRTYLALTRLEGPRGDGRQFVEPGHLVALDDADAKQLLALGLIERTRDTAATEDGPAVDPTMEDGPGGP